MNSSIKITRTGSSEVIIKKSRFLGTAAYVDNEEEARNMVAEVRKQHYDARHVCYAYSIGDENPSLKFSDDGEPGGTAGKPILSVIQGSGISNVIIIVVRYFGGVLLGTGGLVRAYSQAAAEAVEAAEKKTICMSCLYDVTLEYGDFDKVKYLLDMNDKVSYEVNYTDKVIVSFSVPEESAEELIKQISEKTAGRSTAKWIETKML